LRNNRVRHRVSKRQVGGFKSIGIVQGRVSRELRAEEGGFFSRRVSNRAIRTKKRRKVRVTKVLGDIFG